MGLKHVLWLVGMALLVTAGPAWAAEEGGSSWRPIWDLVWRYINFFILAGILFKLAKEPMAKMFASKREEHKEALDGMEEAKKAAQAELAEIEKKVSSLKEELVAYEERLSELAAKERDEIMEQARQEVDLIMERATIQAERLMEDGRNKLVTEMVDMAGDIAAEKIKEAIDASDQARMVEDFTSSVTQQAGA
jgi:F-type H+-transporting ATPase subunit b